MMLFESCQDSCSHSWALLWLKLRVASIAVVAHHPARAAGLGYDRIARNRYRIFGRYDTCLLSHPDHERRFLKAPL
jgi:predicted DCC family thiol-disulfide oxidoreductase YuxK